MRRPLKSPQDCPETIIKLQQACCAQNPTHRPSMQDVCRILQAASSRLLLPVEQSSSSPSTPGSDPREIARSAVQQDDETKLSASRSAYASASTASLMAAELPAQSPAGLHAQPGQYPDKYQDPGYHAHAGHPPAIPMPGLHPAGSTRPSHPDHASRLSAHRSASLTRRQSLPVHTVSQFTADSEPGLGSASQTATQIGDVSQSRAVTTARRHGQGIMRRRSEAGSMLRLPSRLGSNRNID